MAESFVAHSMRRLLGGGLAVSLLLAGAAYAGTAAKVDSNYPAPPPVYPKNAEFTGAQGDVLLDIYVSASGRPRKIRINASSGFVDLDNAAVEAAANWRFVPEMEGGDTVSSWQTLKFHFQLPQVVQIPPQGVSGPAPATAPPQRY